MSNRDLTTGLEEALEPEIVASIGLFLIGQEREGLQRYGKIRYTALLESETPDDSLIDLDSDDYLKYAE
jgi:hypothetical protein